MHRYEKHRFGNCIDCHLYAKLDDEARCMKCAIKETELVEKTGDYIRQNPRATREEIIDALKIDIERVDNWIRSRKIKPINMQFTCPRCGHTSDNKLTCFCVMPSSIKAKPRQSKNQRIIFLEFRNQRDRFDRTRSFRLKRLFV